MRARVCLVGLIAAGQSGVPRYAAALLQALDRIADDANDLELVVLSTPEGMERVRPTRLETVIAGGRLGRHRAGLGRVVADQVFARRAVADLLHFFDLTGPALAPRRPFTTTVHDAAVRHRSGVAAGRMHKRLLQPWAARAARATVAVSQFAKEEAVRHFGADPARIHVVHSGPGLLKAGRADGTQRDEADPYLLYVGDLSEHKNLPLLIRSFGRADPAARLVLVGRRGEAFDPVQRAVDASPARERIDMRSGASDDELECLYRRATALFLPSKYEGFGFTPLEAMARGCPVVASDIPALREVSGSGALLISSDDAVDDEAVWATAIRRVLTEEGLRSDLRRRGAATVARYSWDRTARGVCEIFHAALESNGSKP